MQDDFVKPSRRTKADFLAGTIMLQSNETDSPINKEEILRYKELGAYHWNLNSSHLLRGNAFVRARYENILKLVEMFSEEDLAGKRVLDHGCGDGVLSYLLAKKKAHVVGMDVSRLAVQFAQSKTKQLGIHYQIANAIRLPYRSRTFDCVVSSQVIEHIASPIDLLHEIYRVLKKDGFAIVSTRIKLSDAPIDPTHVNEWFKSEFQLLISSVFKKGTYFESHPVFWMEASYRFKYLKYFLNLLSSIENPFSGFDSKFRYNVFQYAVVFK